MVRFEPFQYLAFIVTAAQAYGHSVSFVPASPEPAAGIYMVGLQPVAVVSAHLAPAARTALNQVLPHYVEIVNSQSHIALPLMISNSL